MTLPYKEGTWFALPLEKGGYGVGRVARHSPGGRMLLAYFFGPKHPELPALVDVGELTAADAVDAARVGDLALIEGSWPILGESLHWSRGTWPVPAFISRDDVTKTAWRVRYSDEDPAIETSRERIPYEAGLRHTNGSWGTGVAETRLTQLLDP